MTPLDEILSAPEPRLTRLQECQRNLDLVVSCLAILKEDVRTFDAVDNEPLRGSTDATRERLTKRRADLKEENTVAQCTLRSGALCGLVALWGCDFIKHWIDHTQRMAGLVLFGLCEAFKSMDADCGLVRRGINLQKQ